jgi:hypothetical protein
VEKQSILEALEACQVNKSEVARRQGLWNINTVSPWSPWIYSLETLATSKFTIKTN